MTLDTMDGLLQALRRLHVETGGMACLGCGHERDCGVHGCAIIRKAMERLSGMTRADHPASTDKMVPLTLEQLREMDGKPVWVMEQPDWGHWELSEDADDYFSDRDPGLYGLTYPDPEGKGGIHKLGWIAYAYPPPQAETAEARLAKTGSGKEINMASLKRLTDRQINSSDRYYMNCSKTCIFKFDCQETCDCEELDQLIDRLGQIEDILGDDYDLDRLRELVAADR